MHPFKFKITNFLIPKRQAQSPKPTGIYISHFHLNFPSDSCIVVIDKKERASRFLLPVEAGVLLVNARSIIRRISPECNGKLGKKLVHATDKVGGGTGGAFYSRLACVDHHAVREIGGHNKVVFHNESRLLRRQNEFLYNFRRSDALL